MAPLINKMKLVTLSGVCLTMASAACIADNMDVLFPLMLNPACPKILDGFEFFDVHAMTQDTDRFCYSCYQEMDSAFNVLIDECAEDARMAKSVTVAKDTITRICALKDDEHCGSYMQLFSNCNLDDEESECTSACRSSLEFIREYDGCCLRDLSDIFSEWNYYGEGAMEALYSKCDLDSNALCPSKSSSGQKNGVYQAVKLIPLLIIKIWSRFS